MSQQTLSHSSDTSFAPGNLISVQSDESALGHKWPKGWRYLFIIGIAALFWLIVFALFLWA